MGNQLASQASVPHQDVALAISLLLLWSSIGASIGSAVSVAVWSNRMPGNLREFLPASVNETQIADFFADSASLFSSFSSSSEAGPRHQLTSSFCRPYASHYHQRVRLPLGHPTGRYQGLRVSPFPRHAILVQARKLGISCNLAPQKNRLSPLCGRSGNFMRHHCRRLVPEQLLSRGGTECLRRQ